jgi:VCBS repeat-containing protein
VTDDNGGTDTQDIVINLTGTNDAPVITSTIADVDALEDSPVIKGTVISTDVDTGSIVTFSAPSTDGFIIDFMTGEYSFNPSNSAYQSLSEGTQVTVTVPVTVTDDNGVTDTQNIVINLTGTNDAPVVRSITSTVEEGQAVAGDIIGVATDSEDGFAEVSIISVNDSNSGAQFDSFKVEGNEIALSSTGAEAINAGSLTDYNIVVEAKDSFGATTTSALEFTVVNTTITAPELTLLSNDSGVLDNDNIINNKEPMLDIGTLDSDAVRLEIIKVDNGETVLATATRTDVDTPWSSNNSNLQFNVGNWTFQSIALEDGRNDFKVKVTDNAGNTNVSDSLALTIDTISPEFDVFDVSGVNFEIDENTTAVGNISSLNSINGQDTGSAITYSLTDLRQSGLFNINTATGAVSFKNAPDFEAPTGYNGTNDYFAQVKATDAAGNSALQHAKVEVVNVVSEQVVADTSVVLFDLVGGASSSHSERTFDAEIEYTIYIKVDSDSGDIIFSRNMDWNSANNLGADDVVILVGNNAEGVQRREGNNMEPNSNNNTNSKVDAYGTTRFTTTILSSWDWSNDNDSFMFTTSSISLGNWGHQKMMSIDAAVVLYADGSMSRYYNSTHSPVVLWSGTASGLLAQHGRSDVRAFSDVYQAQLPEGVHTSQVSVA